MSDSSDGDDMSLFREAMRGVRPLNRDADAPADAPKPAPVPHQLRADERAVIEELRRAETDDPADLGAERGEAVSFLREGLQKRVLRRLRRGHYSVAAELDLHGMTSELARSALREFMAECRRRDHRCVRIIHGKGRGSSNRGPVLKGKVNRWLRQRDDVLAFCSARPVDGGTGALYVLLRHS
ncbi:MAG: Smr/MutS family protein [Ectothiorhodospiraceae bacterium]|jgi:DNA-nicking Smr family endonuclease